MQSINLNRFDMVSLRLFVATVEGGSLTAGAERFGMDRFKAAVARNAGKSADQIAAAILAEVTAYRGEESALDDVTLVVLKRTN